MIIFFLFIFITPDPTVNPESIFLQGMFRGVKILQELNLIDSNSEFRNQPKAGGKQKGKQVTIDIAKEDCQEYQPGSKKCERPRNSTFYEHHNTTVGI